jgi:hypothetical protein
MANWFPGTWRVDGATGLAGYHGDRIDVRLSQMASDDHLHISGYSGLFTAVTRGEGFRIHTSMLSRFTVGSIWRNGRLVALPPARKEVIQINPEDAIYCSLSQPSIFPPHWPSEVLPEWLLAIPAENREALRSSMFAVVPILGKSKHDFLIVPCVEILRFYFGVSSRMMTDVIRGEIRDRYADFDIENAISNGRVQVRRKMPLSRSEILVIAQALCSETSRSSLFGVHNSLSTRKVKNQSMEIECRFPCSGPIELTVAGIQTSADSVDGKSSPSILYAMRLESSNHRMDADGIDLIDDLISAKPIRQEGSFIFFPQDTLIADEEMSPPMDDLLTANKRARRVLDRMHSERFPGLTTVQINHDKTRDRDDGGSNYIPVPGNQLVIEAYTPGDGDYQADNQRHQGVTEFIQEADEGARVARDLDLFLETCSLLTVSTTNDWIGQPRIVNTNPAFDKPGYSRFEKSPTNNWSHLKGRSRYLVIFDLQNRALEHYYLLEMELKENQIQNGLSTMLIYSRNGAAINEHDWSEYLTLCSAIGTWVTAKRRYHPKLERSQSKHLERFCDSWIFQPIPHPRSVVLRSYGADLNASEDLTSYTNLRAYDPAAWAATLQKNLHEASCRDDAQ